jgi:hypothetical protein
MKFPKSVHAEGWATHLDAPDADARPAAPRASVRSPMHAAKPAGRKIDINAPLATPEMAHVPPVESATAAAAPRVQPQAAAVRPQPQATHAATLPPRRADDTQRHWMIAAGAGAAIVAALAVWGVNRHHADQAATPPTVTGSAESQGQVATAANPAPEAAAASQAEDASTATATTPATTTTASADTAATSTTPSTPAAETAPQRLGLPVTTAKPAVEPRRVAQADAAAARPDLVVRANPRDAAPAPAAQPAPSPALQPRPQIAAAPAPDTLTPGTAPINMPPTSAGVPTAAAPAAPQPASPAVTPQAATPPVATTAPDTTANPAAATGTPTLAQAQPTPAAPSPEDAGITQQVRVALASEATLAGLPIAVSTDHGVVKLEGQAPDTQARERATVVAAGTSGVKAVDNRLTVPPVTTVSQAPNSL